MDGEAGDDATCRPNQVFAISLRHPVLDRTRWRPVLEVVRERLLTPVGLRSLSPDHTDYKSQYHGDLRARDAAYHQGTVWAWLIGPFIDAWVKLYPESRGGAQLLAGFAPHLDQACVGTISEIFDAEARSRRAAASLRWMGRAPYQRTMESLTGERFAAAKEVSAAGCRMKSYPTDISPLVPLHIAGDVNIRASMALRSAGNEGAFEHKRGTPLMPNRCERSRRRL